MSSSHEGEVSLDLSLQIGPPSTDDHALSDRSMFQRSVCVVNASYFCPSPMHRHHRRRHPLELQVRSRLMAFKYPTMKQSTRAPRMRWTSSLHAHFVHAVQLLGGHEKSTPKSILELMDVKGLTLAHVKSHLQMYRALKSSHKPTASTGSSCCLAFEFCQSEVPIEEDLTPGSSDRPPNHHVLDSNVTRIQLQFSSDSKDRCRSNGTNACSSYDQERKDPSLEFTLGTRLN